MAQREAQRLIDLGHALEDRPTPLRGQNINEAVRAVTQLQAGKQRLRHDHVTDPAGSNNKNSHKLCKRQTANDKLQTAAEQRASKCSPLTMNRLQPVMVT